MHDVASTIAFKRRQIASLAEIGSDAAAAASKRLAAEVAALESQLAVPAEPEAPAAPTFDERLSSAESAIADLRARLAVVEVLTAPQA